VEEIDASRKKRDAQYGSRGYEILVSYDNPPPTKSILKIRKDLQAFVTDFMKISKIVTKNASMDLSGAVLIVIVF
jgi:hypothetical protein